MNQAKAGRIIGLDYGLARIGVAMSDERKIVATTVMTFSAEKRAEATASKLAQTLTTHAADNRYAIEEIVIGMPLMMNGKRGMQADEVSNFITLLKKHFSIPITAWDERLSTVQADRSLREGNFTRKRRSTMVDTVAATIILQSYLDHKNLSQ